MVTIRKIILSVLFIVVLSVLVFAAVTEADAHTGNRRTSTNFANCVNFGGDLDGDFICDGWEPPHAGGSTFDVIVTFPNGIPSYVYKCGRAGEPVCPTETSKDILVEVDCTNSGQCPSADAINLVRNAFSTQSITLHVQVDANDLASSSGHSDTVRWPGTNMSPGFDQIKRMHFGTAAERSDVNGDGTPDPGVWDNTGWNQKKQIFHYAIFAKFQFGNPSSSGIGETHGNDFMVTLGNWAGTVGSVEEQAGTLMHELGHNLNLQHGGSDTINCKPNYLSVMSYSRQMPDLVPTRKVDYSRVALGPLGGSTLLESGLNLDEIAGLISYVPPNAAEEQIVYGPTPPSTLPWTGGSIDWDNSGLPPSGMVSADINALPGCGSAGSAESLTSFNDWGIIRFDFKAHSNSADGVSDTSAASTDIADETTCASLFENNECVREVSNGVSDGTEITPQEWRIEEGGDYGEELMKIVPEETEITKEIIKEYRHQRINALEKELSGLSISVQKSNSDAIVQIRDGIDTDNFLQSLRGLAIIKNSGTNKNDSILEAVNSIIESHRKAAYFIPNDENPAPFSTGSPRQQESLGIPKVKCKDSFVLFKNRNDDRPYCISSGHADDFEELSFIERQPAA